MIYSKSFLSALECSIIISYSSGAADAYGLKSKSQSTILLNLFSLSCLFAESYIAFVRIAIVVNLCWPSIIYALPNFLLLSFPAFFIIIEPQNGLSSSKFSIACSISSQFSSSHTYLLWKKGTSNLCGSVSTTSFIDASFAIIFLPPKSPPTPRKARQSHPLL